MKQINVHSRVRDSFKMGIVIGVIAMTVTICGCSGRPSERNARTVLENLIARDGDARIISFKKVNATTSSMYGQEMYTIHFTVTVKYIADSPRVGMFQPEHRKGEIVTMNDCQLVFEKTEMGWQGEDGNIY